MKKNSFIFRVTFGSLVVIFLTAGSCYAAKSKDEQAFEKLLTQTNALFSRGLDYYKKLSGDAYAKEAKQQQEKFDALVLSLKQFSLDNPRSVYADDADYIFILFWGYAPGRYIQEARAFLKEHPGASLEPVTLNKLQILSSFVKEAGLEQTIKTDIAQFLYSLKKYEESARESRGVIDYLNSMALNEKGRQLLGLNYFILMKDYESLLRNDEVRRVCKEAIVKLKSGKDMEDFVKKLKELDGLR